MQCKIRADEAVHAYTRTVLTISCDVSQVSSGEVIMLCNNAQ